MTVFELMERLQDMPQGMEVNVAIQSRYGENEGFPISDIYVEEFDDGEIIQNVLIVGYYED